MDESGTIVAQVVQDAADQIRQHPSVLDVNVTKSFSEGAFVIEAIIDVPLPSRAIRSGVSATGVKSEEKVSFEFCKGWPIIAPNIGLRGDFPLNLPHINPHKVGDLVRPCIYFGDVSELLHEGGLDALVDQVADWLGRAAANTLMDLNQGWEPLRRDSASAILAFDADKMVSLLKPDGGVRWFPALYYELDGQFRGIVYTVREERICFSHGYKTIEDMRLVDGRTSALLIGQKCIGDDVPVLDTYYPETIQSLPELYAKAKIYGIDSKLVEDEVEQHLKDSKKDEGTFSWPEAYTLIVIFALHRPAPIIGGYGSAVELLPYLIRYSATTRTVFLNDATIREVAHEQIVNANMLAQTSGTQMDAVNNKFTVFGCGSLGSKVSLHLGRAGFGKQTVVDKDVFSSHNLARNALLLRPEGMLFPVKAWLVAQQLYVLGHTEARQQYENIIDVLENEKLFLKSIPKGTKLIIDTTASLAVFEAECTSEYLDKCNARLVRSALLNRGKLFYLAMEGANREVRVDDLRALLYATIRTQKDIHAHFNMGSGDHERMHVGQSCSAFTTILNDSEMSRAASMITMQIQNLLENAVPDSGTLCIGYQDDSGIGVNWQKIDINETTVLKTESAGGWEVRVIEPVYKKIAEDVVSWKPNETGGALLGHVFPGRRTIVIADIIDAPSDSERSPGRFKLGINGLEQTLRLANRNSLGYLHFIGTWHSHPMGGDLSTIDKKTLEELSRFGEGLPVVSLVWTPQGLICDVKVQ